jgi:hypothetical protein
MHIITLETLANQKLAKLMFLFVSAKRAGYFPTWPRALRITQRKGMRCEQLVAFVITRHKADRYEGKPKEKRCGDRDDEGRLYLCNRHELERLSRIRRFGKPRG